MTHLAPILARARAPVTNPLAANVSRRELAQHSAPRPVLLETPHATEPTAT